MERDVARLVVALAEEVVYALLVHLVVEEDSAAQSSEERSRERPAEEADRLQAWSDGEDK
jgi:hypothetical protein